MSWTRKFLATLSAAALAIAMLVAPAAATPSEDGDHKVLICHVTNSGTNPYVVIEVDFAAFDGEGDDDHTQHVSTTTGLMDIEYVAPGCGGVSTAL